MATEDFTFPVLTDPVSCIIDSPPLWCLSPAACPGPFHEEPSEETSTDGEESDQEEVCKNRSPVPDPSLSGTEELGAAATKVVVRRNGGRNDKEEEMDMLWEDFNTEETLTRNHGSSRLDSETTHTGCVRALKLSKPNGTSIISPRKPGMVVFMKVLKRLFLIHNFHRSAKHRSSYRPSVKGHRSQTAVKIGSW
uniref:Uncharacterized protein n=1 Tax=Salix viminalis TaxID=40686 RepID=A0A6N2M8T6_SALVM